MTSTMLIGYATDRGRRRDLNEDSILVERVSATGESECWLLLAVADGMGGLADAHIASQLATRTLRRKLLSLSRLPEPSDLEAAFWDSDLSIRGRRGRKYAYARMGTTLVAAVVTDFDFIIANVGDSRAYVINRADARQITVDHSYAAEKVSRGILTPSEALKDHSRNQLTRCLGATDKLPKVDIFRGPSLRSVGSLLLCTDGLYAVIELAEIARVVSENTPQAAADELVRRANEEGGPDNISVVVVSADARP